MFDQSTLGKIDVEGPDVCRFLERICTNRMDRSSGGAIYTMMLNHRGGIESDLTAIRFAEDHCRLFVGTAAIKRDLAWLGRQRMADEQVNVTDRTADEAIIGLMGPKTTEVIDAVGAPELNCLGYFKSMSIEIAGIPVLALQLSYVGEPGFEISCPASEAPMLYDLLYANGARPAGLHAQTSMRIEKRFLAYGHDLDTDVTPLEAGLDFAIDWQKDFLGKEALLDRKKKGPATKLVTLLFNQMKAWPLGSEPVYRDGEVIGKTTSATFGHRIGRPLALAYLDAGSGAIVDGTEVEIDIAGDRFDAQVSLKAAFDSEGRRMRSF